MAHKANMAPKKNPMPEQEPLIRAKNFGEVSLGYDEAAARDEAMRCLGCKKSPCMDGCPVGVRIPEFIEQVRLGEFEEAYQIIASTNSLPAVCGRVCPQESQCEGVCLRGKKSEPVAIGRLERFVADYHANNAPESAGSDAPKQSENPEIGVHKVAVVGSGPAGLTCAGDLARLGFSVTVFEAFHAPGGVLVYGIPEFRLPKDIVAAEVRALEALGVKVVTNAVIGRAITIDELMEDEGFEAVFIGTGAGLPVFMGIPGENLLGVYSANEYLTRINLMKAYKDGYDTPVAPPGRVVVVGGGNVAMDAARCALRMGAASVSIVYRRGLEELPARAEEVHHAMEEGVEFRLLHNPVAVNGDERGRVCSIECVEMELGEPDDSGRRRPVEKPDSNVTLEVDTVIMAIGTSPNPLILATTEGLDAERGCITTDENMATSRPGVYAGGDAVTGAATVILAMGAGKTAARAIAESFGG